MKTKYYILIFIYYFLFTAPPSFTQVSQQWVKLYNGNANSNDAGNSVCITPSMYIAITGFSSETNFRDVYTALYSQSGNTVWEAHYNGEADNDDYGTYITSDLHSNIIVAGSSIYNNPFYGSLLIKYNRMGIQLWAVRHDSTNGYCFGTIAKTDSSGNIYFGEKYGTYVSGTGRFSKYGPRGNLIWQFETGRVYDILIANDGSVYSSGTINSIYLLNKYTPGGVLMYSETLDFGPGPGNDGPLYIAGDSDNNIICTGSGPVSGHQTTFIVKLNQDGQVLWQKSFKFGDNSHDAPKAILVDGSGSVYIGGSTKKFQTTESEDFFLLKYSNSGDSLWTAFYDGPASNRDYLNSLAFDRDSNIIAAGTSLRINNNLSYDYVTVKFDGFGSILWVMNYNGSADTADYLGDLTVSRRGDIIVTGSSRSIGTGPDITTIKYKRFMGLAPISNEIPQTFILSQNYPNPFNPVTKILFYLPKSVYVKLTVFDVIGKEVAILVKKELKTGIYKVEWDGTNCPSGVYFYRLTADDFNETRKMVLLK